ncbi:MAG: hypothetical protein GX811_01050 [Lentisphaerae bacterium]|nr:hypothetical protein [Lentisphaerota bacterium]
MQNNLLNKIYVILAVLAIVLGISFAINAVGRTGAQKDRARIKHAEYSKLTRLFEKHKINSAAIEALEQGKQNSAADIPETLEMCNIKSSPAIRERGTRQAAGVWAELEVEVTFRNINPKEVATFILAMEKRDVPWMLSEFHASAVEVAGKLANIVTVFRTLTKKTF